MKKLKKSEFSYIKTLEPEEFSKLVEAVSKEARRVERGMHDSGCPYPIKASFWSRLFSFL